MPVITRIMKRQLSGRVRTAFLLVYVVLSSLSASFTRPTLAQSGGKATVIVTVTGLRSEKGQVKIAVFNLPERWLGEQPVYSSAINVDGQSVTWKLNAIPYGDYGIAVLHDENKNGTMDKNFLGIPQEPYGFSNNVRVTLGPPKWDNSKFAVRGSTTEVSIEVK